MLPVTSFTFLDSVVKSTADDSGMKCVEDKNIYVRSQLSSSLVRNKSIWCKFLHVIKICKSLLRTIIQKIHGLLMQWKYAVILLRMKHTDERCLIFHNTVKFYDFLECYLKLGYNRYESTPLYGIHHLCLSFSFHIFLQQTVKYNQRNTR